MTKASHNHAPNVGGVINQDLATVRKRGLYKAEPQQNHAVRKCGNVGMV
jgi:hypothetical protein